jgi:hypothetical protein
MPQLPSRLLAILKLGNPQLAAFFNRPMRRFCSRTLAVYLLANVMLFTQGCASTEFYQREKLNDRAMQFDQDGGLNYLRQKIEAAREGSLGGFGAAEAGGCGCQ